MPQAHDAYEQITTPNGRQKNYHVKRRRSDSSVHGFVLAVFRARTSPRWYHLHHSVEVDARVGREFATELRKVIMHACRSITFDRALACEHRSDSSAALG
jgi:hypothetical protein